MSVYTVCDNITLLYIFYKTKRKRNALFLHSARRQLNKQTKWIVGLNDSTFLYKQTEPKQNDNVILSHTVYAAGMT